MVDLHRQVSVFAENGEGFSGDAWVDRLAPNGSSQRFAVEMLTIPGNTTWTLDRLEIPFANEDPAGWYEVRCSLGDLDEQHVIAADTLEFWKQPGTPVREMAEAAIPDSPLLVSVAPNPFNDRVTVTVTVPRPTRLTTTLVDLLGRDVLAPEVRTVRSGASRFTLSLADRASGIYWFVVRDAAGHEAWSKLVLVR